MIQISPLDQTLSALADPTRRQVIDLLRQGPKRAGELANLLSMSAPALSRHLKILRKSGLIEDVEPEEDARVRLYQLRPEPFSRLRGWLEEVEAFWTEELTAFKEYAERTRGQPPKEPKP